jgi:hypothetical protein
MKSSVLVKVDACELANFSPYSIAFHRSGEKTYRVNTGDSFALPSSLSHRFYNDTSMDTVVFRVNSRS